MSFYRSFASKDALVTAYLREQEREYWACVGTGVVARHPKDPRRQIEALFESAIGNSQDRKLPRLRTRQCGGGNLR